MLFLKLNALDDVNKLCNICNKYKDKMDVDIKYGRYLVLFVLPQFIYFLN